MLLGFRLIVIITGGCEKGLHLLYVYDTGVCIMAAPIYTDPDVFAAKCEEYFLWCDTKGENYTIPGLAYHLGFNSRQSFCDYKMRNGEPGEAGDRLRARYADAISRARLKIESQRVSRMLSGEADARGSQFDLKNNFGYVDRRETDVGLGDALASLLTAIDGNNRNAPGQLQAPDDDVIEHGASVDEDAPSVPSETS